MATMTRVLAVFPMAAALACGGSSGPPVDVDAGTTTDAAEAIDAAPPPAWPTPEERTCPTAADVGCGPWFGTWFEQVLDASDVDGSLRFVDASRSLILGERMEPNPAPVWVRRGFLDDWSETDVVDLEAPSGLRAVAIAEYVNLDVFELVALLCTDGEPAARTCFAYRSSDSVGPVVRMGGGPLPEVALHGVHFVAGTLYAYGDGIYRVGYDSVEQVLAPGGGELLAAGGDGELAASAFVGEAGRAVVVDGLGAVAPLDTGLAEDLRAVDVFGETVVVGGSDGSLALGGIPDGGLTTCAPGLSRVSELVFEPWQGAFVMGVDDGVLFGAADGQVCTQAAPPAEPVVGLATNSEGTCAVLYAVTASAVFREVLNCTE